MLPVGYRDSENDWLILLKLEKQRRLGYFDWLNSNFHNIIEAKAVWDILKPFSYSASCRLLDI
jgi:hypothetical protein